MSVIHLEATSDTVSRRLRELGALLLGLFVVASVGIVFIVHGGMKRNAIRLPYEKAVNAVLWMPEGWKFFTRDCREQRTSMYVLRDGVWQNAARTPNANPANAFGLDRIGRAQGIELGLLTDDIPADSWQSCEGREALACLDRLHGARRTTNVSPRPSLCGTVGLVTQRPTPWAWESRGLHATMPVMVLRLEVQC